MDDVLYHPASWVKVRVKKLSPNMDARPIFHKHGMDIFSGSKVDIECCDAVETTPLGRLDLGSLRIHKFQRELSLRHGRVLPRQVAGAFASFVLASFSLSTLNE